MSRGDEEIIDDALDMLAWQRRQIAVLEEALREIEDFVTTDDREFYHHAVAVARKALGETK